MSDKLNIANEMAQFDRKNRKFYDELTDDERKKFSNYLMIRWGSTVQGTRDLQEYYLLACNERLNKNFFELGREPKLQWLCATTVSPDMGVHRHQWIASKKKEPGNNSVKKQLTELFPHLKDDEIEVMSLINTKKDIDDYVKALGRDK
jgi:hypothetical protein